MVELLLEHSASLTSRTTTADSLTPAQLAQRGHHRDLAARFRELAVQQSQAPASTYASALLNRNVWFDRLRRNFEANSQPVRANSFVSNKDQRSKGTQFHKT
ncbi:unnamed protein product [Echinostoma caproni]|uniref:ANK_REP_REGION domain-containing protein n=1 Tax=Echinostoma caproni TaxID=27848 RepID=A0A183A0W3_9TREM|nr:unnamed protein product [Echinostoma caproni]